MKTGSKDLFAEQNSVAVPKYILQTGREWIRVFRPCSNHRRNAG